MEVGIGDDRGRAGQRDDDAALAEGRVRLGETVAGGCPIEARQVDRPDVHAGQDPVGVLLVIGIEGADCHGPREQQPDHEGKTGDNVGIGGFIITGSVPKHVVVRAIGPSTVPGALVDPVLELHGPPGFVTIINDNCADGQIPPPPPFCQPGGLDAGIEATLAPGAYTAIVRGKNNTTGVALVEVYDVNQGVDSKLANISTRAFVGTADNIVIAGFILGGNSGPDRVLVRGIGPSLTGYGVPNALADPTLELRDSNGVLLLANNNWQDNPIMPVLPPGMQPTSPLESAIMATLPPGLYTALLAGVNGGTGVGLVEVYDLGAP